MQADLLLAATTGLLGGFGHCAGMCGPLVASVGLVSAPGGARRAFAGQVLYNAGRVGAVMGLTGSFVNVAGRLAGFQDAVAVAAGALMVLMGLGASGLFAAARRAEERIAGRVFRAARAVLDGGGTDRYYALGLMLGFLPCGLSYSAFVGAAATGSLPQGLLFALAFALGTVPALLLVGGLASALSPRLRGAFQRAGGVAVALVGLLFVLRGLGVHVPL